MGRKLRNIGYRTEATEDSGTKESATAGTEDSGTNVSGTAEPMALELQGPSRREVEDVGAAGTAGSSATENSATDSSGAGDSGTDD